MKAYEAALKSGDTRLLLSPDSQFFRYFNDAAGQPGMRPDQQGRQPAAPGKTSAPAPEAAAPAPAEPHAELGSGGAPLPAPSSGGEPGESSGQASQAQ
jgi:hypothetical protein